MAREYFKNLPNTTTPLRAERINGLLNGEESIEKIVAGSIEGKNLFDKNNANTFSGTFTGGSTSITTASYGKITYIPIQGGKAYTIQKMINAGTNIFRVCTTETTPAVGVSIIDKIASDSSTNVTITTSSNAKYLAILYTQTNITTTPESSVLATVQIEKGSSATEYDEFMKYGYNSQESMGDIVVDDVRCRNIFDINGNVNIQANDGSQVSRNVVNGNILTINSNSSSHYPVGQKFTNLNGKTITFSATVVSAGSSSAALPRIRASIADNGTVVAYTQGTEGGVGDRVSVTASCTSDNVVCGFVTMNGTGGQVTDIQVEINDEVTNYTPYKTFDNSESEVYSSNEIRIGRWIDGKPLYRRVFTITSLTSGVVQLPITNVDLAVNIRGCGKCNDSASYSFTIPMRLGESAWNVYFGNFQQLTSYANLDLYSGQTFKDRLSVLYIILDYTKTTD